MKGRKLPLGGSLKKSRSTSENDLSSHEELNGHLQSGEQGTVSLTESSPSESNNDKDLLTGENPTEEAPRRIKPQASGRRTPRTRKSHYQNSFAERASTHAGNIDENTQKEPKTTPSTRKKAAKDDPTLLGKRRRVESIEDDEASRSRDFARNETNPTDNKEESFNQLGAPLLAYETGRGTLSTVRLVIEGQAFFADPASDACKETSSRFMSLGHDGNQFYCQVCGEFGDVVCCDGCPLVYHKTCIPVNNPAHEALNHDPWFCPECIKKKSENPLPKHHGRQEKDKALPFRAGARSEKADRRNTSQHRCVDCGQEGDKVPLEPCSECGNYVHFPSCLDDISEGHDAVLCSTCRAVDTLTREEDTVRLIKEHSLKGILDKAVDDNDHAKGSGSSVRRRGDDRRRLDNNEAESKRKRSRADSVSSDKLHEAEGKFQKHQRKKSKDTQPIAVEHGLDENEESAAHHYSQQNGPSDYVRAVPAFFFYLAENRWKIERILARKHRYFNRLPRGREKNELVCREAALWWVKLRPTDHRRYMTMSMRDFESRIIEWKEEKNLRVMVSSDLGLENDDILVEDNAEDILLEDEKKTRIKRQHSFNNSSVGGKPFKPDPGHSYNRVLLDLLHDLRFHPCPMLSTDRAAVSIDNDDLSAKATIPYFEVHGPVSTSVGDECLGCSRGWRHFCPVLKRVIPAVEHRAKLQPPLCSLTATRIGLGLRPPLVRDEISEDYGKSHGNTTAAPLFAWRLSEEAEEIKQLPIIPSCTLGDVSERFDDIVHVIQETTSMTTNKESTTFESENTKDAQEQSFFPLQQKKDSEKLFKCGRCRAVSNSSAGCIQCRRAQLVINLTKKQMYGSESGKGDSKALKIQTVMLGRVQTKEGTSEMQSSSDQAICNAILKHRWTPIAILPSHKFDVPHKRCESEVRDLAASEDSSSGDSSSVTEVEDMQVAAKVNLDIPDNTEGSPPFQRHSQDRPRTRQPPTRLVMSGVSTKDYNETDRRKDQERQTKIEGMEKRCISIANYAILFSVLRRDPLKLFASAAVTAEPDIDLPVERTEGSIDFSLIREKVLGKKYNSVPEFLSDIQEVCERAMDTHTCQSAYWKTAKDINNLLGPIGEKANRWMDVVQGCYTNFLLCTDGNENFLGAIDAFSPLRREWPMAVELLERGDNYRYLIEADLMRTEENENAYYGTLAIRRASIAAAASLAPTTDSLDMYSAVVNRGDENDEMLRLAIDEEVVAHSHPIQLAEVSCWREESVVRLLRKVQCRRIEKRSMTEHWCSRCIEYDRSKKNAAVDGEQQYADRKKRKGEDDKQRVESSRLHLITGLASSQRKRDLKEEPVSARHESSSLIVKPSKIHGMGVFADRPFRKGDVVTEYVGEYINEESAQKREKHYRRQRITDFICRVNEKVAIDATRKGNATRFVNHSCDPNCYSCLISDPATRVDLQRMVIIAVRDIEVNEEITYDYRIPLELDLSARIPCNCQADGCRGFMVGRHLSFVD